MNQNYWNPEIISPNTWLWISRHKPTQIAPLSKCPEEANQFTKVFHRHPVIYKGMNIKIRLIFFASWDTLSHIILTLVVIHPIWEVKNIVLTSVEEIPWPGCVQEISHMHSWKWRPAREISKEMQVESGDSSPRTSYEVSGREHFLVLN